MIVNKSRREKIFRVVACVVIGLLLVSCTRRESVSQVAVFGSPAYAVTSEIAAEGEIVNATPLGSDPHYMEFTSSVARVLEQSKAVIALGASADRKMVSELSKPKLFLLPEGLEDPHVWLSPKRVLAWVPQIQSFLDEQFPNTKNVHAQNAEKFMAALQELDANFEKLRGYCFVTQHPAFTYVEQDYGWRVLGTLEVGEAEISPKQLTALMEALKSEQNCLLLLNPYEPSKTAEVLSEQLGLPSVDFDILEVATRSYSSIMAENIDGVLHALRQ